MAVDFITGTIVGMSIVGRLVRFGLVEEGTGKRRTVECLIR